MMRIDEKRRAQKGQAAIEFIVSSVVIFFFLFFLLSLAIVFVASSYLDYATYMAARTYKTGALQESSQERAAQRIFLSYFDKIQGITRNPQIKFVRTNTNNVRTAGILASWDIDLFYLPPVFTGTGTTSSAIRLNSEVHLGRDPSALECQNFFTNFIQRFGIDTQYASLMEDNGC